MHDSNLIRYNLRILDIYFINTKIMDLFIFI